MTNEQTAPENEAEFEPNLPDESKAARFRRIGKARLIRAAKSIRLLQNLGNRSQYEYDEEQIDKIERALLGEVDDVMKALRGKKREDVDVDL